MSANIDTMIYVHEKPWHGLGTFYEEAPKSSEEIIGLGHMDWTTNVGQMYTKENGIIPHWYSVYREDNGTVFGVVNKQNPSVVQNRDTFRSIDNLMGSHIDFETAASLGSGETVFGCFKIQEQYNILGDEIDHYFVVVNDHLKPDGKILVMNTPIRVVCQNTLTAAMNKNSAMLRVPVGKDQGINIELAKKILNSAGVAINDLSKKAKELYDIKIDRPHLDKILDEMFPIIKADETSSYAIQNMNTEYARTTFVEKCLAADNLNNFRGTAYAIFNAQADFEQHYFKKADKAYDLNYRMKTLPRFDSSSDNSKMTKLIKMLKAA